MRNHGVSRIHRPSTDHRSVFDLGLINERSPRPHVQSLLGSAQPSADAGSAIRPARPQKSRLVGASYGRVCGVSRRARADTRSPGAGPSPAGAGGQSRKSGPLALVDQPHPSGFAAHAMAGELRFCRAVERCLPPHRCARRWLKGWIASPLAGVRPSPVGQIVALSGNERVYARHQWCRRLDMAGDQSAVGVSGLWWVSDILRGMSLDSLVAQVGQVLGDARSLYGAAPQGGG